MPQPSPATASARTSPAKSATHLPRLDPVGQTDRMMTDAEALRTLAREDPAVAEDARTALRSLTTGDGLGAISLLRLQEFLWYTLPGAPREPAAAYLAVATALARLFTLAGMERYAEACASRGDRADPRRLRGLAGRGRRRLHPGAVPLARCAAGHRPAGVVVGHGPGRAVRLRRVRRRDRARGRRGRAAGSASAGGRPSAPGLVERWLTRSASAPEADTWLSRISAERIEEWAQGHPGERVTAGPHRAAAAARAAGPAR